MKPVPLLLAASALANVALLGVVLHRPAVSSPATTPSAGPLAAPTPSDQIALPPRLLAALRADNPAALRDLLRAAGLSEPMIRQLVRAQISKAYGDRLRALTHTNDAPKHWWKDNANVGWDKLTDAQRAEVRAFEKQARDELRRLLGEDLDGSAEGEDPRLAFLPAEKRQALLTIEDDYRELENAVHEETRGFHLRSDEDKLRFLHEEKKRDILALLDPEERRAYELRTSETAQQLRWKLGAFDPTEEEFLAAYALQKEFDDRFNRSDSRGEIAGENDPDFWEKRQAAEKALNERIRALVGEQRYADAVRSRDGDFQQLEAATRRFKLPADTPERVYALREPTAEAARKIAASPDMTADQKRERLAALAGSTRDQVIAALGEEAGRAYLKHGMRWLEDISSGNAIVFNRDDGSWESARSAESEP